MNIALCIPTRSSIMQGAFYRLLQASMGMTQYVQANLQGGAYILTSMRAHAGDARNDIVQRLLKDTDAEWSFWLDDDAMPPVDTFQRLFNHGKDIVVPVHRTKTPPFNCPAWMYTDEGTKLRVLLEPPRLQRISHCGMHAALIHRKVFEKMNPLVGEKGCFQVHPGLSEDCFFFQMAGKIGFEVGMDTSFTVDHAMETSVEEVRKLSENTPLLLPHGKGAEEGPPAGPFVSPHPAVPLP